MYILNSRQHHSWLSKSQCRSCSNDFHHTSIICQHSSLRISSGINGNPCKDGVTGGQEHVKAEWCRCLWEGWHVAVLSVLIPLLLLEFGACHSWAAGRAGIQKALAKKGVEGLALGRSSNISLFD